MTISPTAPIATRAVVYLTASPAADALAFYIVAFGALERFRVEGPDGMLGHAEFTIGDAEFMLSDEAPDLGVVAPTTLGGTSASVHLTVSDIDSLFASVVRAGATVVREPSDQPHGARQGALIDPFGHRWMLSQTLVEFDLDAYQASAEGSEWSVAVPSDPTPTTTPAVGGIWAALNFADARAGLRFLTDVLGFEADLVVPDAADPSVIVHSQMRWPAGGIVQAASAGRAGNAFSARPTGAESLYLITDDVDAVWGRCVAAGVDVVASPSAPPYAPDTTVFTVRDTEGNFYSVGSYAG